MANLMTDQYEIVEIMQSNLESYYIFGVDFIIPRGECGFNDRFCY